MLNRKNKKEYANLMFWPVATLLLAISVGSSIFWLRENNLRMIELKNAVYIADKENGDVEKALNELRLFVYGHMNTNLRTNNSGDEPPIQLVYRFNRAVVAEQARVVALGNANKVYVDAQNQCEKASIPLTERASCIQDYVMQNAPGLPQLDLPAKELYTFDFASPFWSPDMAGISILIALIIMILIVARAISLIIVKRIINKI